jgi:CRP-like cAMP-binding protein
MERMIEFLKACPYFRQWGRTPLTKLSYFFKKVKYRAGNFVYQKGDISTHVYIVLNGEFEQTLTIKVEKDKDEEFDHAKYLMAGWDAKDKNFDAQKSQKIRSQGNRFEYKCCLIGRGQLIGEEDAIEMLNHSKTVKCKS